MLLKLFYVFIAIICISKVSLVKETEGLLSSFVA